jgi:hypothetical protein
MSYVLILLMAIDVVVVVFLGGLYPSFYIQGGRDYKESNRVGYNMITVKTLCLLAYFIDIVIYTLGSTSWSSKIFWMIDRVVSNPSLDHPSPCGVPRVPILVKYTMSY